MKSPEEEVLESLRLIPYIDSREDGRSSSHKGIVVDHWTCTSRTKFFVLLELGRRVFGVWLVVLLG